MLFMLQGAVRLGMVGYGQARLSKVQYGMVWHGFMMLHGTAGFGEAGRCGAWQGQVGFGRVRRG